jgi:hypothetical protein
MDAIRLPHAIEPDEWFVVFHRQTPSRLLSLIALGRFKHVSAFAYCPGFKLWLLYDTSLYGTRLILLPHGETAKAALVKYTAGCAIVKIAARRVHMGTSSRLAFYCVPAVKHLIGLRCVAMRPDALYRQILRSGGVPIHGCDQPRAGHHPAAGPDHPH